MSVTLAFFNKISIHALSLIGSKKKVLLFNFFFLETIEKFYVNRVFVSLSVL